MEDAVPPPGSSSEHNFLDATLDFDLMDDMLAGGCWLETANCSELLQLDTPTSTSPLGSSGFSSVFEIRNSILNPVLPELENHVDAERPAFSMNQPPYEIQVDNLDVAESLTVNAARIPKYSIQSSESDSRNPSSQTGTSTWIQPRGSIVSVQERLRNALTYLKESQRYGDVLVQIWVPVIRGDRQVLTTYGQPFTLDTNCLSLVKFRTVSTSYQFSAEENSNEALGLPGWVFLSRVPEWTPDVRYFSSHEYPRVTHAEHCDVHGSIALPIFEPGNQSCLGVMEVVMTARKINYRSDLENICNALQAVNLRSSEVLSFPLIKASNYSYQATLPEIYEVLRTVCNMHRLPLAQTWIPCIQQGKKGSRHSDENYKECVSTVDDACYVIEPSMLGFHEACSEHHLFRGQGVVGKAFRTNQPCFSSDITTFCKAEYPLAHHAKLFHLRAAVAIRLRSIHTSDTDFVLEFFLPVDCWGSEEQKLMLNSLSTTIQQVCHSLRVVTAKELEDEAAFQANELIPSDISFDKSAFGGGDNFLSVAAHKGTSTKGSPCVANIMEAQQKGISSVFSGCVPLEFNEQDTEIFGVSTHWDSSEVVLPAGKIFTEFKQNQEDSDKDIIDHKDSFPCDPNFLNAGKATEKRRTKTEKTVSLQVLRQYFAGSLKDAAKSIGVCPTTLKRICRQHGITRWPSRKIKKVGHSLRKLQVVIDSVQGAEGAFQFSSVYEKFTKASGPDKNLTSSSTFSALKQKDHPEWIAHQQEAARLASHTSASNSLSSSCSQSSSSSIGCSSGTKLCSRDPQLVVKQEASMEKGQSRNMIKRAHSQLELCLPTEEPPRSMTRSQSHEFLHENLSSRSLSPMHQKIDEMFKVKATYAEEKVRFKLQPTWCFQDLKQEIVKRFSISDIESVDLKYLDDDDEWVLLRCDADLQECIDVHKLSHALTIKISVYHISQLVNRASITTQHCHEYERIQY